MTMRWLSIAAGGRFVLEVPATSLAWLQVLAGEVALAAQQAGIHAETMALVGKPHNAIAETAKNMGADLIVMGAFGHSRLHDLILGGTTAYMIRETTIPIMLIR